MSSARYRNSESYVTGSVVEEGFPQYRCNDRFPIESSLRLQELGTTEGR